MVEITYPGQNQIRRNLTKHICRAPNRICEIQFGTVKLQILLHAAVESIGDIDLVKVAAHNSKGGRRDER